MAVSASIAFVLCLMLLHSVYQLNRANNLGKIAGDIIAVTLERVTLGNDYMRNNSARAKGQWFATQEQIGALLKSAFDNFSDADARDSISELSENNKASKRIFSAIVANRDKNGSKSGSAVLSIEVEDRLLSQLNMREYEETINGRKLLETARNIRNSAVLFAGWGTFLSLLILIALAIFNSMTIARSIADRIQRLRMGVTVIGDGNLDHRIEMKGTDEFTDLSDAFNKMAAKLSGAENRYRMLFNTMMEGFCIIEVLFNSDNSPVDYRFLEINQAFEAQTGLQNAQGKLMRDLAPDNETHWFEIYGKVALTGEAARFENEAKELNRWYEVYAYRVGRPEDRQVGIIFNDITSRRKAEEVLRDSHAALEVRVRERTQELKYLTATLEHRVVERTAELQAANETLRASRVAALNLMEDTVAARNELQSANKELESFIYSVSHDLRAPLRAIAGFSGIVASSCSDRLNEKERNYLERILDGTARMSQLIEDLLDLSRISQTEIVRKEIDLGAIASAIMAGLHDTETGRQVETNIKSRILALADARMMEVALSNLLGNAWKFTSKTETAVIEFGTIEQDGKTIYFVRDNGAGFDPAYKDKMFLPFHRLHTRDEFEGTGIGLAIVERIVHRHGGRIWAEGEPGKGAAIYFSLG